MDTKRIFFAAALSAAAVAPGEVFRDGDVVVFFGDSITHGGYYHEYITDYYRTRFPEARIRFVNSGIGGDTAAGAMPRVDVDVAEYSPTHVAFHFGMNDVGRGNYVAAPTARQLEGAEAAQERYRRNLPDLVGMVKKAAPGAKMIYMTPTPYDDTAVPTNIPKGAKGWAVVNQKGCNTGLSLMAGYVLASAKKDGVAAVDWFTPLNDFLMRRRANDPHYMLTRWDRVHPGPLGHSIMAWRFLLAQGAPAVVSDVCVDAVAGRAVKSGNAEVSAVSAAGGGVSFTVLAKALPFPVPPEAGEALAEFKVEERLNRETLSVRGLKDGLYSLRIDGEEVGAWSAAEFARGVNLGFNAKTPQYRQAQAFFRRNAELAAFERTLRGYHSARWFYGRKAPVDDVKAFGEWFEKNVKNKNMIFARSVPGYLAYWPTYKETRAKLWADQEAARAIAKPVPRRYEVVPADAAAEPVAEKPAGRIELFNGKDLSNWYVYLKGRGREDPRGVFTVKDGVLHISGAELGCITTEKSWRDYRLTVEYRFAQGAPDAPGKKAPDSGILYHSHGADGSWHGIWMKSFEYNLIIGKTGDMIVVVSDKGKTPPDYRVASEVDDMKTRRWTPGGQKVELLNGGRVNSCVDRPDWRNAPDERITPPERPYGEWNTAVLECRGSTSAHILNGKLLARFTELSPSDGRIQIQSEGYGFDVRRITIEPID